MEITIFNEEQEKAVYELFRAIEEKEGIIRELEENLAGTIDDRDGIYEMYEEASADLYEMRRESRHFEDKWLKEEEKNVLLERKLEEAKQQIHILELELKVVQLQKENDELRRENGQVPVYAPVGVPTWSPTYPSGPWYDPYRPYCTDAPTITSTPLSVGQDFYTTYTNTTGATINAGDVVKGGK